MSGIEFLTRWWGNAGHRPDLAAATVDQAVLLEEVDDQPSPARQFLDNRKLKKLMTEMNADFENQIVNRGRHP